MPQVVARSDIIAFYNQVFVPAMKSFLLKGESSGAGASGPRKATTVGEVVTAGNKEFPAACVVGGRRTASSMLPGYGPGRSPRAPKLSSLPAASFRGSESPRNQIEAAPEAANHDAVADAAVSSHAPMGNGYKGGASSHPMLGAEAGARAPAAFTHTASATGAAGRIAGARTKSAGAPVGHQIPDGLAALLQVCGDGTG
jgi:hypothetical protein